VAFYLFVLDSCHWRVRRVIVLQRQGLSVTNWNDLNGLYRRSPASAGGAADFMLSLAGIPPLAAALSESILFCKR